MLYYNSRIIRNKDWTKIIFFFFMRKEYDKKNINFYIAICCILQQFERTFRSYCMICILNDKQSFFNIYNNKIIHIIN